MGNFLIFLAKRSFFFQNIVGWLASKKPAMVEHNLGKYGALKRAFYLTALEALEGDYLEFGVFTGSSFTFAARMNRELRFINQEADSKKIPSTKFLGFDSFQGFGNVSEGDKHPFYLDSIFKVNADRVIKNIKKQTKGSEVKIFKGYFDDTIKGKTCLDDGVKKIRVMFIDCDLKDPATLALEYCKPAMQQGMILMMDDFFSYRGDESKGLSGAFNHFQQKYPNLKWRKVLDYGYGGVAYICSNVS